MQSINKVLEGKELDEFFEGQIVSLKDEFLKFVSQFDATDLFHKWREFIRHIDELCNITSLTTLEEDNLLMKCSINILNDPNFGKTLEIVGRRYGIGVQQRFLKSCQMLSALNIAYAINGQHWNCCRTLGEAFARCQAMRLYYVTMLLFIPQYCKGDRKVPFRDVLNVFQPMIDKCLVNIRTSYNALLVNKSIDDFKATPHTFGLSFNFDFNHLEEEYLEPIRMSIVDVMIHKQPSLGYYKAHRGVHELYGYEELEDGIYLTSSAFDPFGINDMSEYQEMVGLAHDLKLFLRDDYDFIVPENDFHQLRQKYPHLNLWCDSDDFDEMLNSRPAFIKFENMFYSTVLLYQRYMVNEEMCLLNNKRRFQIVSGFVFEKEVKHVLGEFDFEIKNIKRINHKEFDVVCIKDDCIYNFQCKNNEVSISQQGNDWFKKTCDKIRTLNKTYETALKKEDDREYLLKDKLKLDEIKNFVICRYPIITRNLRIINFNNLRVWLLKHEMGLN